MKKQNVQENKSERKGTRGFPLSSLQIPAVSVFPAQPNKQEKKEEKERFKWTEQKHTQKE